MKLITMIMGLALAGGLALAKDVTAEIKVKGMTCGFCAVAVKKALTEMKGVKSADVSVEKGLAKVVYEESQVTEKQMRDAINKTGFTAEPSKGAN